MKKKIYFVVQKLADGGAERVVSVLSNSLSKMDVEVGVIICFPVGNEYALDRGVNKIYLAQSREEYFSWNALTKLKKIREQLKALKPDYIIPFLYFVGVYTMLANVGLKGKLLQTIRNDPKSSPNTKAMRALWYIMLCNMWRGFVQNKEQFDFFPKFISKKMAILPNPIADEFFSIEHIERPIKKIVSAGRLQEQKNFFMLIEAAADIKAKGVQLQIEIYGEGDLRDKLQNRIDELDVSDYCRLCGRSDNIRQVYESADLFVMTSNYEGMPNALMEAMASGLPCISTDCPTGPSDLIQDGVNGSLIRINDSKTLAQKIIEYVNNPADSFKMGQKAKCMVQNIYSADVIAQRFLKEVLLENQN